MKCCKKCGSVSAVGDDDICVWCEDTKVIKLDGDDGFVIVDKDDKFCTQCGRAKRWIDLFSSRIWACPKC